jgi:hypothetical protein
MSAVVSVAASENDDEIEESPRRPLHEILAPLGERPEYRIALEQWAMSSDAHRALEARTLLSALDNPEAASEKRKRGRPRAWYSRLAKGTKFADGSVLDHDADLTGFGQRTRRGRLNAVLASRAFYTLVRAWRPEWAWFWYAKAGEIDNDLLSRCSISSRTAVLWTAETICVCVSKGGGRRVRLSVLTELGRLDCDEDVIEWAAELVKMPLDANTRRIEKMLRNWRLGRAQENLTVESLATKIAKVIDRAIGEPDVEKLDLAAHALDDVRDRIDYLVTGDAKEVPFDLGVARDEPEQIRVAVDEPRVRIADDVPLDDHHEPDAREPLKHRGAA